MTRPQGSRRARAIAVLLVAQAALASAVAQQQPLDDDPLERGAGRSRWEAGLAAGGGVLPDYPGADESHARAIAAPVLLYRGPVLRVDREGARSRLLDVPDLALDLTATAAFNAHDNAARAGMPGLDYLFGLGPQLVWRGWRDAPFAPTLHLKLRAIFSTDLHRVDRHGSTLSPELRLRAPAPGLERARLTFSLQPTWGSRDFNAYFYEVAPGEATASRPAYRARAGYLGTEATLGLWRRETATLSWFASASLLSLHGAANAASPLLRSRTNASVGLGLVWTPWQSAARAAGD